MKSTLILQLLFLFNNKVTAKSKHSIPEQTLGLSLIKYSYPAQYLLKTLFSYISVYKIVVDQNTFSDVNDHEIIPNGPMPTVKNAILANILC